MVRSEALKKAQVKYYNKLKTDPLKYDEFKRNNRKKLKEKKDKLVSDTKKNTETVDILLEENDRLQKELDKAINELSLKQENK